MVTYDDDVIMTDADKAYIVVVDSDSDKENDSDSSADTPINPFARIYDDSTVVGESSSDEEEDFKQKPDGMTDEQFRAACHDLIEKTLVEKFPQADPLTEPFIDFGNDDWEPICRNDDSGVTLSFIMTRDQTMRIYIRRQEITDTLHEFANRYPLEWFDRDLKRGFELCGGGVRFRFHTTSAATIVWGEENGTGVE